MTIEQDLEENARETVKQKEEVNSLRLSKEDTSARLDLARADRAAISRKLELAEGETKDQRQALRAVEDKLRSTEVAVGRLDVELDNILRKLSDDYEPELRAGEAALSGAGGCACGTAGGAASEAQHLRSGRGEPGRD